MDETHTGTEDEPRPDGGAAATPYPDPRAVAVGDVLVVSLLVAWGMTHHGGLEAVLDPIRLLETVGPFAVGFLAVAVLAGAYSERHLANPLWSLRTVVAAWIGAAGLGVIARTHPEFAGGVAWPFGLVVLGSVVLGLLAWRLALVGILRQRRDDVPA